MTWETNGENGHPIKISYININSNSKQILENPCSIETSWAATIITQIRVGNWRAVSTNISKSIPYGDGVSTWKFCLWKMTVNYGSSSFARFLSASNLEVRYIWKQSLDSTRLNFQPPALRQKLWDALRWALNPCKSCGNHLQQLTVTVSSRVIRFSMTLTTQVRNCKVTSQKSV